MIIHFFSYHEVTKVNFHKYVLIILELLPSGAIGVSPLTATLSSLPDNWQFLLEPLPFVKFLNVLSR